MQKATSHRTHQGMTARWSLWAASLLAIAPSGLLGQSQNIVIFGTGVNTPGNLLADGAVDSHYTLFSSADPGFPGPNAIVVNSTAWPIPPWLADGPNSKWIAPQTNQGSGNAAGNYTYRTTFNLSSLNPSTAVLTGQYASDNTATMSLNGVPVGPTSTCLCSFTPFTITSGFQAGLNTLDFVVNNAGSSANPTGLRVDISGTASALTTVIVFGTGVNTPGSLLADGSVDPHYVLRFSADPGFPGPNAIVVNSTAWPIPPWIAEGPNSKWIAPQRDQNSGNAAGNYTYRTTVDLTNLNPSSVVLTGQIASDNSATMLLNGAPVGPSGTTLNAFTAFTIASGFQAGVNTLDFVVNNAGTSASPTGLRVDLNGTVSGSGFGFSPASASFLGGGGVGHINVTAGAGVSWSATSTSSWITISSGGSGSGSGTVNYSVDIDSTGAARSGGITINGQTFSVTQSALVAGGPSNVSVSPSSTASPNPGPVTFTFTASDQNGYAYIDWVQVLYNWAVDGSHACYMYYDRRSNSIYLMNDTSSAWSAPAVLGVVGQPLQNSQCSLDPGASHSSGSGTNLNVSVALTIKPQFLGPQNIFALVGDHAGNQIGWLQPGTWTGYAASSQLPTALVTPNSGSGMSATLAFHSNDVNGWGYIPQEMLLINSTVDGSHACFLLYYPNWNGLYLMNDAANSWGNIVYLGNGTLSNSQCSLDASQITVGHASNNDLTLNLPVTFTQAFQGQKNIYAAVTDHADQTTAWTAIGTWNVSNLPPPPTSNPINLDLPDTPFGKGPPPTNAGSCGIADCGWFFSSITYVSPAQMFGSSGTYSTGPNGPFYTNHTSARMVNEFGQDLGLACSGESISYGSSVAYARVPCDSLVNFYLFAPHLYTLIGQHQTNNGSYTAGVHQTFDSLGFVPAGASWDFNGVPMGPFSDFRYAAGPTIAPNSDGVTVRYTTYAVSTISVHIDAPYSARKGRHQLGFPTYDIYGLFAANEFFAIIIYDATPLIASVSPSSVPQGTRTTLTIAGTGFGDHPTVFVGGTAYNPGAPSRNAQGQDVVTVSVTLPPPSQGTSVALYLQSNGAGGQAFFGSPQGPQQGSPISNTKQVQVQPVTATLTNTPLSFIPRNSIGDACQIGGCTQQYTVTLNPPTATGIITFQLNSSALPGYATNACFNAGCTDPYDSAPDYWFEGYRQPYNVFNNPSNNDQTIQTTSAVNSATVTVSSRDFGGTAKLSATVNGTQVTAMVTETQESFARIPIDICRALTGCRPNGDANAPDYYSNGIADSWEIAQAGRYLEQNEDNEEGSPGSASRGDGYSAHDEYRGFITWDGTQVVHVRTDPVNVKDVFYWDQAGVGDAVRGILAPATSPGMKLYQILDQAANLRPPTPEDGPYPVNKHNRNSATPNGPSGFAVVYISGGPSDCALTGNELGLTRTLRNDGSDAITIDNAVIACSARRFSYDEPTFLGQVVAHETGHKFGIQHPTRKPAYIDLATLGSVGALGADQFTVDTSAQLIYVWLSEYTHSDTMSSTGLSTLKAEHVARPIGITNGNGGLGDLGDPSEVAGTRTGSTAIYSIHYTNPLGTMPGGGYANLIVEIQEMLIMDWAPNLNVTAWSYNTRDILAMCVKQTCP